MVFPIMGSADVGAALNASAVSHPLPAAMTWDATYPLAPTLKRAQGQRPVGNAGYSAFNDIAYANCRNGTIRYNGPTGNDTTGDGSLGNPYRTPNKAVTEMNALGLTYGTLITLVGTYSRTGGGVLTTIPNFHLAWVSSGGAAVLGVNDTLTWSQNTATFPALVGYPNVWAVARSQFSRADNPSIADQFGNPPDYIEVSSVAKVNSQPGLIYSDGTNVYVFPHNGAAASDATVRAFLDVSCVLAFANAAPKHFFMTGDTDSDYFEINGSIYFSCSATPAQKQHLAFRNVKERMCRKTSQQNGIGIEGWHGLVSLERCSASQSMLDLINGHNILGADMSVLTVNCAAVDAGRAGGTSCNSITGHEDIKWVDIAGDYSMAHGGTAAFVNTTQTNFIGSRIGPDLGDVPFGGTIPPRLIRVLDTAKAWFDECSIEPQKGGAVGFSAAGAGQIFAKNMDVSGLIGSNLVTQYTT